MYLGFAGPKLVPVPVPDHCGKHHDFSFTISDRSTRIALIFNISGATIENRDALSHLSPSSHLLSGFWTSEGHWGEQAHQYFLFTNWKENRDAPCNYLSPACHLLSGFRTSKGHRGEQAHQDFLFTNWKENRDAPCNYLSPACHLLCWFWTSERHRGEQAHQDFGCLQVQGVGKLPATQNTTYCILRLNNLKSQWNLLYYIQHWFGAGSRSIPYLWLIDPHPDPGNPKN